MSKLPHYLEAALSFRSISDLNKRYSKFIDGITVGYECEISGGELGDNENEIDEEAEIRTFDETFHWDYQDYITLITNNMTPSEVLEKFDITPKYGFFNMEISARKDLISKLRQLHYRVVGLPMQNGDPIMEEPDLNGYQGYSTRQQRQEFAHRDTRLINAALALRVAKENFQVMQSIHQDYPITSAATSYAVEKISDGLILVQSGIKSLQDPKVTTDEVKTRSVIYGIGEAIAKYYQGWHEVFRIMLAENTHYFFVYDENKLIVMLDSSKYSENGLQSDLLEWSEDGKEYFEEDFQDEYRRENQEQLQEHLNDARSGINEDDSSVVDKIHTLVVNNVDEDAELSQGYHQSDNLKGKVTVVEGDSSISPAGAEVVSKVFTGLQPSFKWLESVFNMIEDHGLETNETTGLHVNIGTFMAMTGNTTALGRELGRAGRTSKPVIDVVKLAILSGDHYLLDQFGRFGNSYAKSLSSNIRDLASANFDFKAVTKSGLYDTLIKLNHQFLQQQTDRYRTVNMQHLLDNGYLEFRIAGGRNYHYDTVKVKKAIYRYVQLCAVACDPQAYFKEYMTELYRLFVGSKIVETANSTKKPRPKNVQEAMYVLRAWSSNEYTAGREGLDRTALSIAKDAVANNADIGSHQVLDIISGLNADAYKNVTLNVLYSIRLLVLWTARKQPNPKQYLAQQYPSIEKSIKDYIAPKLYRNKPQWVRFFFTGAMAASAIPKEP